MYGTFTVGEALDIGIVPFEGGRRPGENEDIVLEDVFMLEKGDDDDEDEEVEIITGGAGDLVEKDAVEINLDGEDDELEGLLKRD